MSNPFTHLIQIHTYFHICIILSSNTGKTQSFTTAAVLLERVPLTATAGKYSCVLLRARVLHEGR